METLKNPSYKKLNKYLSSSGGKSGTILHYTGNMWGMGARLSDTEAIAKIRRLKQRSKAGMILLVPALEWFEEEQIAVPPRVWSLMQQYLPGNLSIAFKVDDPRFAAVAQEGKVAFRVPTHPLLRNYLALIKEPMLSTSINHNTLPPEAELKRILAVYGSWFDLALLPAPRDVGETSEVSTLVEYTGKDEGASESLKCLREGSIPFYEINQSFQRPLVMFVCTGNICRSPIAEKLFNYMVQKEKLDIAVDSSGLIEGGRSISLSSLQLLMEAGIAEAAEHVSKRITPQMVASSWLVLTMEERQRDFLREQNPDTAHKILTLNEITGFDGDIKDPYLTEHENYVKTYNIIFERLQILLQKIKNNEINL